MNVTLDDDASFNCQISQVPLVSRKAIVTVWVKPDPPVIVDGPVAQVRRALERPGFRTAPLDSSSYQ